MFFSDHMLFVIYLKRVSLLLGTVSSNRRNVNHSSSILNESPSFDWNVNIGKVFQIEIYEFF